MRLRILTGVACLVAAMWIVGSAIASADILHLKSGGKIEGKVVGEKDGVLVVRTRFGTQRIPRADVLRIEKKATLEEEYEARASGLDPEDGAGHLALARWCRENGLPGRARTHFERVVALDPANAEAQEALGRVQHDGRWVTPEEKAELERRREIAEKRAQGLVLYEGRWVTKEEREAREKGLVFWDGVWRSPDEVRRAQGYVEVDGEWVHRDTLANRAEIQEIEKRLGLRLKLEDSEHFSVRSELSPEHIEELVRDLEKGWKVFHQTFAIEGDLLKGRKIPVVEVIEPNRFQEFLGYFAERNGLSDQWLRVARAAQGIYHYDPLLIADSLSGRNPLDLVNSAVNKLGKILGNLHHANYNYLPAWYEEGIGVWLEVEVRGNCYTYTLGGPGSGARGKYKRPDDVGKRFDRSTGWILIGEWEEMLRQEVHEGRDTLLERLLSLELAELSTMDVAKSWSIVRFLLRRDRDKFDAFLARIRHDLPRYESNITPRERTEIQRRAIEEIYGMRVLQLEEDWKKSLER